MLLIMTAFGSSPSFLLLVSASSTSEVVGPLPEHAEGKVPAPSNLIATQTSTEPVKVTLNWSYTDPKEANSFEITSSSEASKFTASVPVTQTTYVDTEVSCGTTYTYTVRAVLAAKEIYLNGAYTTTEVLYSNALTTSFTTKACPKPKLTVSMKGPAKAVPGDNLSYTLTVKNEGDGPANYLFLYDDLPKEANFVAADKLGQFEASVNEVFWQLDPLPVGQSQTVQLTVTAGQNITNQTYGAYAQSATGEEVEADGSPTIATQISDTVPKVAFCARELTSTQQLSNQPKGLSNSALQSSEERRKLSPLDTLLQAQQERTSKPRLTTVLAALNPSDKGKGKITVAVTTVDEKPVAGVAVTALAEGDATRAITSYTELDGNAYFVGLSEAIIWHVLVRPEFGKYTGGPDYKKFVVDGGFTDKVDFSATPLSASLARTIFYPQLKGRFVLADKPQTALKEAPIVLQPVNKDGSVDPSRDAESVSTDDNGFFWGGKSALNGLYNISGPTDSTFFSWDYADYYATALTLTLDSNLPTIRDIGNILVPKGLKQLQGRVTFADGTGVPNVNVKLEDQAGGEKYVLTDKDGNYKVLLKGGKWSVSPEKSIASNTWYYTGNAESITFAQPVNVPEAKTGLNFTVESPSHLLTGRVLQSTSQPFGEFATIDAWDEDRGFRFSTVVSTTDGSFKLAIPEGRFTLSLWVNKDNLYFVGKELGLWVIQTSDSTEINLGPILALQRIVTIKGKVLDAAQEGLMANVSLYDDFGHWFTVESLGEDGSYEAKVPPGKWYVGAVPPPGYLTQENTKWVSAPASEKIKQGVDFSYTSAKEGSGQFEDASGDAVSGVAAMVYVSNPNTGEYWDFTSANADGSFTFNYPQNCAGCVIEAALYEGTPYSLLATQQQIPSTGKVSFKVAANQSSLQGHFLDAKSKAAVTGLKGWVYLFSQDKKVPSISTGINKDGSYVLNGIGTGTFALQYYLGTNIGEALVKPGNYFPSPLQPFTLTFQPKTALDRDLVLEPGEDFKVTVLDPYKVDNGGWPALSFPTFAVAQVKPNGSQVTYQDASECTPIELGAGKGWASQCASRSPTLEFSATFPTNGKALLNIFDVQTSKVTFDDNFTDVKNQSASLAQASLAVERSGGGSSGGKKTSTPPKSVKKSKKGLQATDIITYARKATVSIVGQVFDAEGPRGNVIVAAFTKDEDDPTNIATTDASGCYNFRVAPTNAQWQIWADLVEDDSYYYQDRQVISGTIPATQTLVFGPQLKLVQGEKVFQKTISFERKQGLAYETPITFGASEGNEGLVGLNIGHPQAETESLFKFQIPPDNGASDQVNLSISILPTSTLSAGSNQVVGKIYSLKFTEATGKRIELFNSEMAVEMPYNLATLASGTTEANLYPVFFSRTTNTWKPLAKFTLDSQNQMIKVKMDQMVDALAIFASPTSSSVSSFGSQKVYLPFIKR